MSGSPSHVHESPDAKMPSHQRHPYQDHSIRPSIPPSQPVQSAFEGFTSFQSKLNEVRFAFRPGVGICLSSDIDQFLADLDVSSTDGL